MLYGWQALQDLGHLLGADGLALMAEEQFACAEPQGLEILELSKLVLDIVEALDLHPVL